MPSETPSASTQPILFFDGVCGLCNGFVDFILRWDKKAVFRFSPLQGETAAQVLDASATGAEGGALRSFVLWDHGRLYWKSDAALQVLKKLGGPWTLALVFHLVPRLLRNAVYDFVARNRYRWFGRLDACRMPTPAERSRFLP